MKGKVRSLLFVSDKGDSSMSFRSILLRLNFRLAQLWGRALQLWGRALHRQVRFYQLSHD